MRKLGRLILGSLVLALMSVSLMAPLAFAVDGSATAVDESVQQGATVLPDVKDLSLKNCYELFSESVEGQEAVLKGSDSELANAVLACGIKTGSIRLFMIPYYIRYILEFIIQISGLVCVGSIVYGGFFYLFSGLTEEKDKGKNAIKNGIIGMIVCLTAWGVVNVVMMFLTA